MEEFRWGCRVRTTWPEDWQALRPLVLTGPDIPEDRPPGRVFSHAQATEQSVWAAALAAREYRADRIIAFGDGDVLSCGKLAAMASGRKLTTVPTDLSGLAVTGTGRLNGKIFRQEACVPDLTVLDGKKLKSAEIFPVLSRSVEAYAAKNSGILSDCLSTEAFRLALNSREGEKRLLADALSAVAAENAGEGVCGVLCRAVSAAFPGMENALTAIFLPAAVRLNAQLDARKYAALARSANLGGSTAALGAERLCRRLERLRQESGLPEDLLSAGIRQEELWRRTGDITAAALADPALAGNPRRVEAFMLRRILDGTARRRPGNEWEGLA